MLRRMTYVIMLLVVQTAFSFGSSEELTHAVKWYGVQWCYSPWTPEISPVIASITYFIEGDTTINAIKYCKLFLTNENENITHAYQGAVRESVDGKQVYYVPNESSNEYLLYDFNVQQGDVVYVYTGFSDNSCEMDAQLYPDKTITPAWTVLEVQTLDGRKHVRLQDETTTTIEWIEGVGTQYILWPKGQGCAVSGNILLHRTLCAIDNEGETLYTYSTDDLGIRNNCSSWETTIDNVQGSRVQSKKVIRDEHVFIQRGEKVYTLQGQEIR